MMQPKSKMLAGVLAIILGSLGIHNFYLGQVNIGIFKLVITLFFVPLIGFLFRIVPFVMGLWGIIDGIYILTGRMDRDADGNELI